MSRNEPGEGLPAGWASVSPQEVAKAHAHALTIGPFGSNLTVPDYQPTGVPLIFVRHIRGERFDQDVRYITPAKAQELAAHVVQAGDLLITKMGEPPGDSTVYPTRAPGVITADCIKWSIEPTAGVARYFMYALRTAVVKEQIRDITKGVAQKKVSLERFRTILLPAAPLGEQQRIADELDSYLSRLDAAVANLERAQAKLKAYRASVLKSAVEGRLVPTEAELARQEKRTYEPAQVLLERILKERRRRWEETEFAKLKAAGKTPKDDKWKAKYEEPEPADTTTLPELPDGWCWARLEQLLVEPLSSGRSVPDGDGFPVLRLTAIRNGIVDLRESKSGLWGDTDPMSYAVKQNDFLIVRGNGSIHLVGRGGRVVSEPDNVAFPDTLIRATISPEALLASLLPRWWHSPPLRAHVEKRAKTTAGIYKVNQADLADTPVPLPPYVEQSRIAEELERLDSVGAAAERDLEVARQRVSRLRQSILKWAFEGKLVDQDPTDEPADKLLARIRAERAAKPTTKTRGRKAKAAT